MHHHSPEAVSSLIRNRRSVFPNMYLGKEIPGEVLHEILENANWAPTHKKTEPWRFRVFKGEAREQLAQYLAGTYKQNTPPDRFSEKKYQKKYNKVLKAPCIIAICMQRDPAGRVPEWEEIAAVACAVQNMWLTCSAYGIGAYWSTPSAMEAGPAFLNLKAGERCLGLFYMGYAAHQPVQSRSPVGPKVEWIGVANHG